MYARNARIACLDHDWESRLGSYRNNASSIRANEINKREGNSNIRAVMAAGP